jgi:hypothetical protein
MIADGDTEGALCWGSSGRGSKSSRPTIAVRRREQSRARAACSLLLRSRAETSERCVDGVESAPGVEEEQRDEAGLPRFNPGTRC